MANKNEEEELKSTAFFLPPHELSLLKLLKKIYRLDSMSDLVSFFVRREHDTIENFIDEQRAKDEVERVFNDEELDEYEQMLNE